MALDSALEPEAQRDADGVTQAARGSDLGILRRLALDAISEPQVRIIGGFGVPPHELRVVQDDVGAPDLRLAGIVVGVEIRAILVIDDELDAREPIRLEGEADRRAVIVLREDVTEPIVAVVEPLQVQVERQLPVSFGNAVVETYG